MLRSQKWAADIGVFMSGPPRRPGTKVPLSVRISRTPKGTEIATIDIFDIESFREGHERVRDLLSGRRARAGSLRGKVARRAQSAEDTADVDVGILRAFTEYRRVHPDRSIRSIAAKLAAGQDMKPNTFRNRLMKILARHPRS